MIEDSINATKEISKGKWIFGFSLLALSFLLFILNLPDFINGAPEAYSNQNVRLISGNLTQIFLVSAFLFYYKSKEPSDRYNSIYKILLFITSVFIAISVWLSF